MKPSNLVERLLEDANDGANLTAQELQQIYLKDFNGDLGILKLAYTGKSGDGKNHRYLALFQNENVDDGDPEAWYVTDLYVVPKEDGLHLDFGGAPTFEAPDRQTAEAWLDKESHMKGGGKVVPVAKQAQRVRDRDLERQDQTHSSMGNRARQQRARDMWNFGGSPHWDGNRYGL